MMIDPTNQVRLIPGRAGRGRDGATIEILVMHVQEGTNDLPSYFAGVQADSTMWCKQDGTLVRMLKDTDEPWTNGDVTGPDMTNPVIARLVNSGVDNTNAYSLTIEHQGFASGQFTDAAIEATAKMCAYWMQKCGWMAKDVDTRIVGHFQVGEHKNCPGPNFPWAKLRARVKELLTAATQPTQPVYDPLMDYFNNNGGETVFGKPTSGLYGVNGSIERDFYYCHMYLDKATGKVVAEMKPRENPKGFNVGPGVLQTLRDEGMEALTDEQYYVPEGNKPGLTKRSFTYATKNGVTYRVEAIQDQTPDNKPLPTWTRQVWEFIREYK